MNRDALIRLADALEDVMCETGRGSTAEDRALWWAARPLWMLVQRMLKGVKSD